jgi:protocatechuate 3,4-dioxygenase beta subunit
MQFFHRAVKSGYFLLVLLGSGFFPAFAQDNVQEKPLGPFSGTVVDDAGKPVSGATVWLLGGTYRDPQIVAETTSDEQGGFKFAERKWDTIGERAMSPTIAARDKQGRVGGQIHEYNRSSADSESNRFRNLKVKMQSVKDCSARLLDEAGKPLAKAKIRPRTWSWEQREGNFVQELIFYPAKLAQDMAVESDADGNFTLHNIPAKGRISANVLAEGFGEPTATWKVELPAAFKLRRAGGIEGKLVCGGNPQATANINLRLEDLSTPRNSMEADSLLGFFTEGNTQPDGAFAFENVPAGKYLVMPSIPDVSPFYIDKVEPVEVKAGDRTAVSLALKPAVKVEGKVLDQQTQKGVAGVRVSVYFQDQQGNGGKNNVTTTNDDGAFTLYTRPGKAALQIWQIPEQYGEPSYPQQRQTIDIKEAVALDPILLTPAKALEGIVVDKSGKPVAGAEISCRATDMGNSAFHDRNIRTDENGKFTLKKVSPKDTLNIRARTKLAVAEPVNVKVAEAKEPVRLVVDEKTSFTLRGTVVDNAGKPLPGATVTLVINLWFGNWGTSFSADTCKSDGEGKFEIGGLWAGEKYDVGVKAEGFEKYGTTKITGVAGKTHDFGKIALARADGVVAGSVVDSAGKPLADVRVFNSGDAQDLVEMRTAADGRFRLLNLRNGPVYICAEKDGYRFTGARIATGAAETQLTMLRCDEPPRSWSPPAPSVSPEELKQFAVELYEKLLERGDKSQREWTLNSLAKIDADLAQKWAAKVGGRVTAPVPKSPSSLTKIAEDDLEEAFGIIAKEGPRGYYNYKRLADHFAANDPEKALRCIGEAAVLARSLDQPARSLELAKSGKLALKLGEKEGGKKLILEAAEMASSWKGSRQYSYYLGQLTMLVAACDAPRAIELINGIADTGERDRWKANLAVKMDDIEQAQALLKDFEPWNKTRALQRLAYRIAPARPADAVRMVEKFPTQYGREDREKAAAFGWLATAIAPRDKKLAWSLIDRAFELYLHPKDRTSSYDSFGLPGALLAVQAHRVGYPDMESAIYRAIALRPTSKHDSNPVRIKEANVMMAVILALVDPRPAKDILQSVEPYAESIGSGYSGIGHGEWIKAWALADPLRLMDLADRELDAAKDKSAVERVHRDLMEIAELLPASTENRLKTMVRRSGQINWPDEEE